MVIARHRPVLPGPLLPKPDRPLVTRFRIASDRLDGGWRFAGRSLDERAHELLIDGERVDLPREPMELLLHFLRHAGEIVTKDQLLEAVWPGRIATETALTNAIGKLRAAIGDDDQTIIRVVYGYRFDMRPERGGWCRFDRALRQRTLSRFSTAG